MPRLSLFLATLLLAAACRLPAAETSEPNGAGAAAMRAATQPGHNFAQWEEEVAAYEARDIANPPPKGGLLFAGSSTIRMWTTLAADFPGLPVVNRGFGGTEIVDSSHFAGRLIFPHAPKAIYLRAGTNDIANGKTPAQVLADYKDFVALIHARLPDTRIYFIASCPTIARLSDTAATRELNIMVKGYARWKRRVHYIEAWTVSLDASGRVSAEFLAADKLHLNAAGYRRLAECVRPHLPGARKD